MKSSLLKILFLSLLTTTSFALTGCGEFIAEKATEAAIENSISGEADVDLSNGNFKMKDNSGSYELGNNAEVPDNFPDDVYRIDGTVTGSLTNTADNSFWVMIQTPKSVKDATSEYQSELGKNGWNITSTLNMGETSSLGAEKDNRQLAVVLMAADDQTSVTISETRQ